MRLVILAVLLACGMAHAEFRVEGPVSIPRDSFGEWKVVGEGSDRAAFDWVIEPIDSVGAPTVRAHALRLSADQDAVLFVGAPGKYRFRITIVGPSADDKRPFFLRRVEQVVEVADSNPLPPPLPPDNKLPDGRYGLVRSTYQSVVDSVPVEARPSAKDLARSFRRMVEVISSMQAAGAPVVPVQLLAQTRAQNGEALGPNRDKWIGWAKHLEVQLTALNKDGRLLTADSYKEVFAEIATGLEAVK